MFPRASSSTLKREAPRRGAISMHLGAFSAGNQIFAAGEPLCWCQGRQALECWALECRMWGRLARPSTGLGAALAGWLLGAAVGSAFGWGACAGGLRGKRLEAARVRGWLVGSAIAKGAVGRVGCAALGRIFACCCLCRVRTPCPSAHATAFLRARTRLRASSRWCLGRLGVCSARLS